MMDIKESIKIPGDVEINITNGKITFKKGENQDERRFSYPKVLIKKENDEIILESKKASKREKRIIGTFKAHIKNMIKGVDKGFEYKLKVCSSHFPMNVSVDGDKVIIKNFLGEKIPRVARILEGSTVKLEGPDVTVTSLNKESAGQTAANIEQACRITNRDRRIFNDGIWITKKDTKEMK